MQENIIGDESIIQVYVKGAIKTTTSFNAIGFMQANDTKTYKCIVKYDENDGMIKIVKFEETS